jgi:hypothetical protein
MCDGEEIAAGFKASKQTETSAGGRCPRGMSADRSPQEYGRSSGRVGKIRIYLRDERERFKTRGVPFASIGTGFALTIR